MEDDKYTIHVGISPLEHIFYSEGPKGRIKKRLSYEELSDHPGVLNLCLGDVDSQGVVDYSVVTANGDSQKILTTISSSISKMLEKYPGKWIFFSGNTKVRTRLYRMFISKNLIDIEKEFEIYGLLGQTMYKF